MISEFNFEENKNVVTLKMKNDIVISFNKDTVQIKNCIKIWDVEEACRIIDFIFDYAEANGYGPFKRTKKSVFGELFFHIVCFGLNIRKASSKDADIEYTKDPRFLVRLVSKFFEIFYKK